VSGREVLPLGEVVKPTRPRVKPSDYPELPFIGMEHVEAHSMKLLGTVPAATMKSSAVHFKPGDVLYGRLRPYLNKVYRPTFEGLCSAEFIVLPENDRIYGGYLQYFLNSSAFVRYASHLNTGDRPRVDFDQLAPYEIPLPNVDEQRRIVAELERQFSRLDDAVANLKRATANLMRYKAAVLSSSVTRFLLDEEGSTWTPHLNAGDALPAGWLWSTAGELAAKEPGSIGAGPFGTIFKARDFREHGVPIIFLRHVAPMAFLQTRPGFMDPQKWEELFRPYSVFGGELLITKLGEPPGVCAIYPAGQGPAMVTPDVIKMCVDPSRVIAKFLMYYLNSPVAKRFATGAAFGTTRTRLTLPLFRQMPVPLPPIEEQIRIVDEVDSRLSILAEVENQLTANLRHCEALKQSVFSAVFGSTSSVAGLWKARNVST
jgi:type I restriction enzyme S subunit